MRILMLGNSFTYYHDMPKMLGAMLNVEVVSHTRGGAWLSEQLNPETEMGAKTLKALTEEKWDYVVLQEQSRAPAAAREIYLDSVRRICALVKQAGAKPVIYATWAYRDGTEKLATTQMSYAEMDAALYEGCWQAAQENGALIAKVGSAFTQFQSLANLYEDDDYHPSEAGSILAAYTIARTIEADRRH